MPGFDTINLKKLLEHAQLGVVIHSWDTSIVYANPSALKLLRLTYQQIIGKDSFDSQWSFLDDAGKKLLIDDYPVNKVKRTQQNLNNEIIGVIDSSNDDVSWFMVNAYFEGEAAADNSFIIVTFNDISDTKQLFSFEDIVENIQDIVIVTEADNIDYPTGPKIIYVNKAFETLTGYKKDDIFGETPRLLQGALTDKESTSRIHSALNNHQPINETLLNYDINGRPYWIEMNIIPLKNRYGEVTHFAAIERDISEQKFRIEQLNKRNQDLKALKKELEHLVEKRTLELQKAKAKLEKIAYFDPLTNLPNRRYFIDHTSRLIKSCHRRGLSIAFGLIDIDDFKQINDRYGHDLGDKALKTLSLLLNQFFRADDAICRYGGEEFAFALAIEEKSDIISFANRLLTAIQDLQIPLNSTQNLSITVSVGIKICHSTADVDLELEIKQADVALYQSKNEGKNKFTLVN